jgi:hypothetical protein
VSTPINPSSALESQPEGKRTSRQVDEAFEKVAKLAGSNLPPADFFQEFLIATLTGIQAPAGAIWLRTPQGFLQLQCQYNLDNVGLDRHKGGRQSHNELLRQAFTLNKQMLLGPFDTTGVHEGPPAGNPTEFVNLIAPIQLEKDVAGLVEVWHQANLDARIQRTCLNYLVQMAGYASSYVRNQQGRTAAGQEQVWTQLETFARDIHSSLDPTRVAFQIANEGRRIIGCDRLSVAVNHSKKCKIEAVSGSDVVEKRSNLIQLMRALVDATLIWGEKLVYQGTKDEGLPPDVLNALDDYLAESNSKLLVLQPLRDERQKDLPGPARSALLMENFETPESAEPLIARLEIVGRHATTALYNAAEMKRIPLGWIWKPIVKVQDGLGGKTKAWLTVGGIALALGILALCVVPYPLKMDANGQLLPIERQKAFPAHGGNVENFLIEQNSVVDAGAVLATMYDAELESNLRKLRAELQSADQLARSLQSQEESAKDKADEVRLKGQKMQAVAQRDAKRDELILVIKQNNCLADQPGRFALTAPKFSPRAINHKPRWTVLDADFREIKNKYVKTSDPVLRLGDCDGPWEVELKIPQKHIGQVMRAFDITQANPKLDVDLLVTSAPTRTFRGVLYMDKTARDAVPNRDDHNESAPVLIAYVSLDDPSIPEDLRIPRNLMVTGVEVHAKIRCGNHAMGYSLFYGLWEFLYEKVLFFF